MRVKDCKIGMPVCYNGTPGCELKRGTQGVVTDISMHWVKVRFPTKEVWYTAAQLAPYGEEVSV